MGGRGRTPGRGRIKPQVVDLARTPHRAGVHITFTGMLYQQQNGSPALHGGRTFFMPERGGAQLNSFSTESVTRDELPVPGEVALARAVITRAFLDIAGKNRSTLPKSKRPWNVHQAPAMDFFSSGLYEDWCAIAQFGGNPEENNYFSSENVFKRFQELRTTISIARPAPLITERNT